VADDITKVILDLDNSEFVSKLKESLGLMDSFGSGEQLKGLVETLTTAGEILGVVAAAGLAVKTAVDWTTEAEKINQINNSFQALAASVGLSGTEMKEKLLTATKGLIDDTDLLEAANKAIVMMGDNASRIPEIMELARKATQVFGGTIVENFNNLSMALQNGNTRMLRHYGLVVNATKAQDDYAKSLGVSRDYLDDNGKRLAVMNAALEAGQEKFKNIDENSLQATNGLTRIGNAMKDIGEVALHVWDVVFGPAVKRGISEVAGLFESLANHAKAWFGTSAQQLEANHALLEQHKADLEAIIANNEAHPGLFGSATVLANARAELEKVNAQLKVSNEETQKKIQLEQQSAAQQKTGGGIDTEKLLKDRQKFEEEISKIHKARVDSDLKAETNADTAEMMVHQQSTAIMAQADAQWAKTKKQMIDLGLTSETQLEKARVDIYQRANNQIIENERKINQERLNALKNLQLANENSVKGITASFKYESEQAKQNFNNMAKFGTNAFHTIGSNATSAFEALGNGSKNAADALRGFFFGAIGDIAEQQGEIMLLMGLWPPNPVAIAAGGALIALGAALKSMGSGSSSGPSAGGVSSASSASDASSSSVDSSASTTAATQAAKKTVSINIQGSYFETDQTRTRLMDIIRQAGDQTDFQLKQIGQP